MYCSMKLLHQQWKKSVHSAISLILFLVLAGFWSVLLHGKTIPYKQTYQLIVE